MDSVRIPQMSSQRGCSFPLYFFHTSVPKNEYLFCFCARKTPRKITHPYRNASFPVDSYRTAQQDYDEADVCQRFFLPSLFSPPTSRKLPLVPRAANQSSCSFTTALWVSQTCHCYDIVRLFVFHRPQFQPRLSGKCLRKRHCC